jgi:aryl-alcohol dehydrogenase-like predicted oxidoreductase
MKISAWKDPDRFFAPDGALEAVMAAKKSGKIRHIGFTGHKDPAVHLRMLEVSAAHHFHFDACQLPLNVMDAHFRSFERYVLPKLLEQKIAVLGMKPMGVRVAAGLVDRARLLWTSAEPWNHMRSTTEFARYW